MPKQEVIVKCTFNSAQDRAPAVIDALIHEFPDAEIIRMAASESEKAMPSVRAGDAILESALVRIAKRVPGGTIMLAENPAWFVNALSDFIDGLIESIADLTTVIEVAEEMIKV